MISVFCRFFVSCYDFLLTKSKVVKGAEISKSAVIELVRQEYTSGLEIEPRVVGRAIGKAFTDGVRLDTAR